MATLPTAPTVKGKSLLSSAYFCDVLTSAPGAAEVWTRIFGIRSMTPSGDVTTADNTDWDDVGADGIVWASAVTTGRSWGLELGLSAKDYGTSTFTRDPGQAFLEDNDGSTVSIRWYRRNGQGKVRKGRAAVKFIATDNSGVQNATATFTGDGALDKSADATSLVA